MAKIQAVSFLESNTKDKPNEDCVHVSTDQCFAVVADGATRLRANGRYPDINSSLASECVCHTLHEGYNQGIRDLRRLFIAANQKIAAINREEGITDEIQLLSAVAVAGYFSAQLPDLFQYAFIGDCGVLVYDQDLFPVYMTPNELAALEMFRDRWWEEEKGVKIWRSAWRNKPNERRMTHGGLTGQEEALSYLRADFVRDLKPGDTILLYTDGILPFVYESRFRQYVRMYARAGSGHREMIYEYLETATLDLAAMGVKNFDDDRAFVAFSYEE